MRTATVFNFLVEATLIGSLLIVAALLLRMLIRRKVGSRPLLILWVLIALRLLVPLALPNPVMNWLKPTLSQDAGIRPMADQVRVRVGDAAHELYWKTMGSDTDKTPLHSLLWRMVYATRNGRLSRLVFTVYVSGAALSALWIFAQSSVFLWQVKHRKRRRLPPEYRDFYSELCRRRGLKHPPRVWLLEKVPGSCSFDLIRPVIILPDSAPAEDIPAMLEREVCHVRRKDCLWGIIRNLCCVAHWFNPLVWLAAYMSRTDLCFATDEYALRTLDEPARKAYAAALIHISDTQRARPPVVVAATPATLRDRQLAQRIRLILHPVKPLRSARTAYYVLCALLMLSIFATAEQSSLANLPTLTTPALRQETVTLDTADKAETYARAFLALEGIDAADTFLSPALTKSSQGWTAEWYVPDAPSISQLSFTESGALLGYMSGNVLPAAIKPLATPITTQSGEGQQWCAFLSELIQTHLPELWSQYEAMEIVASGRLDGEQYITVTLLSSSESEPSWQAIIQVSPAGQLISLLPVVG